MTNGIYETLDALGARVKKLCCTIGQILPTQVVGDAGKFLQADGAGGVSWESAGAAYKVYSANLDMATGTATVFQNTLGATPTWTTSSGQLSATVVALIGQTNVYVSVSSAASSSAPKIVAGYWSPSPWAVIIKQTDNAGVNDSTQAVYVEIRVYP